MIAHACHLIPARPGPSDRFNQSTYNIRLFMTYCDCGWGSGKVNSESAALADFRAHALDVSGWKPGIQDWSDFKMLERENARLVKELNSVYANIDRLKESR